VVLKRDGVFKRVVIGGLAMLVIAISEVWRYFDPLGPLRRRRSKRRNF